MDRGRENSEGDGKAELRAAKARLAAHADELRRLGVQRAAVFGSVARGEAGPNSDVDVLVELDPAAGLTLLDYVAIERRLSEILSRAVDLVNRKTLKPFLRERILAEAVDAF
jgi:predicted nucleotidyltransferase